MKEAANVLHSFDLSLSEFVVWWKFLEKLYSKIENSRRKNAREVITKTRQQIVLSVYYNGNRPIKAVQNKAHKTKGLGVTD